MMTTPHGSATPVTPIIVGAEAGPRHTDPNVLASLKDYAEAHKIHPRTVKRWLADNELPGAVQDAAGHWQIPLGAVRTKAQVADGTVIPIAARPAATRDAGTAIAPATMAAVRNYDALPTMLPADLAADLIGVSAYAIHANQDYYGAVKHGKKGALLVPLATVKRLRGLTPA